LIPSGSLSTQLRNVISGTRIARLFVFIVYCSIPFLGGNHLLLFRATIDKFLIENVFLLCLIISLMFLFLSKKDNMPFIMTRFLLFFAPFLAITVFSLVYTWNTLSTLEEINTLLWATGAVFLTGLFSNKDFILKALIVGAFLSSLCAILQVTVVYPALMGTFQHSKYASLVGNQTIPFSSFLYHNIFGGYLASIVPISLYFAIFEKKIFYSITTIVVLTGLILTTTRIGIGLALLTILALLTVLVKDRDVKSILHLLGLTCAGLLVAVLLMSAHTKDAPQGVQREITHKIASIPAQIKTLNTRTEIWKAGLKAFVNKPILGYGAGTFEYPYKKYYDGGFGTKYAHSTLIKIGIELGIVGTMCWLFYLAGCFVWMRHVIWDRKNISVLYAVSACFVFSMVDFSFDAPAHVITFFLLTALLIQDSPGRDPIYAKNSQLKLTTHGMPLLLIGLCLCSFYFTARVNLAHKAIENGTAMAENGFPPLEVYHSYEDAIKRMPLNNEGYIRATGALIALANNNNDAVRKEETKKNLLSHLQKMEKSKDNNSELFYTIGIGYGVLGDKEKVDYYLTKALSYLQSSSYYVSGLAEYYFNLGDYGKAKQVIKSFTPYMNNYETTRNPNGFYVYKIRDLEVEVELREGDTSNALDLARENLKDAERERFVITSVRARELIKKETLINHLRKRVDEIELRSGKG
jgi:O-antigen ligase